MLESQGIGWALSEAGWRGGFGDASMCQTWLAPGLVAARGRCWGFLQQEVQPELSLCSRTRVMPKLSFIGLAEQIKRLFCPQALPFRLQQAQSVKALQSKGDFGLCFGDGRRKSVSTNPAQDPTVQRGWV